MNETEQRIAIAEFCGHFKSFESNPPRYGSHPEATMSDYIHDLNAMHEAERALDDMQIKTYVAILTQRNFVQDADITRVRCWEALHATAAQRAEALLRTIGKWEDSK